MCGGVQRADRRRACFRDGRAKAQSVSCFGVCLYVRARVCVVFVAQCGDTENMIFTLCCIYTIVFASRAARLCGRLCCRRRRRLFLCARA